MGADSLDDDFLQNMTDVIIIAVREDKVIDIKTSIEDIVEIQSVLSTALMMATFHKMKRIDLDNLH